MKPFLIAVCLLSPPAAFAQDTGIVVGVRLYDNSRPVKKSQRQDYKVLLNGFRCTQEDDSSYHFYDCRLYNDEMMELLVVRDADTMQVRFVAGLERMDIKGMWRSTFSMKIPFHKGSFGIPYLVLNEQNEFSVSRNFNWPDVAQTGQKTVHTTGK